tara:strand:+ start:597 stop:800 length:204 start_codon:yes stop_codon:yes gene_type:complete
VLRHVGIDQGDQDTGIEEQSVKNSVGNRSDLLGKSVLSNPCYQFDDNFLKNKINSNNQERDRVTNQH